MMPRMVIPLSKAQQLSLFGAPRLANPATGQPHAGPTRSVLVAPHVRQTEHGAEMVSGHIRHLTAKEAFELGKHELQAHVELGGESGEVAQAELIRRKAKRQAKRGEAAPEPEAPAAAPAPAIPEPEAPAAPPTPTPTPRKKGKGETPDYTSASRSIWYPPNLEPVDDVTDPELGGSEIQPAPGGDPEGTVYLVGVEGERWIAGPMFAATSASIVFRPDGSEVTAREATEEMKRRGARILKFPARYGLMERAHPNAPLVRRPDATPRRAVIPGSKSPPLSPDRARMAATLSPEEATKLAAKAREKGEAIVGRTEADSDRVGLENTHKRLREANERRARATKDLSWGRRLLKLAEQIEAGYQPDGFDKEIVAHPASAQLVQRIWGQWRDIGPDKTEAERGIASGLDHYYKTRPGVTFHNDPTKTAMAAVLAVHGKPYADWGRDVIPDAIPIQQLGHAIEKEGDRWDKDRLKELKMHAVLGFRTWADHTRIAERYARFRELTGQDATAAPRHKAPEREATLAPLTDRLIRAEADERRRWKDPNHKGIAGYFPTPAPEVERMIEKAAIRPGMSVLEPSAGTGDIADRLPADVQLTVAEHSPTLRDVLATKGYGAVHHDALTVPGQFDRVIMNPPFEHHQDIDHVLHAFEHNLKPGGRLVAIVSSGALQNQSAKNHAFREFVAEHRAEPDRKIDPAAWKRSGTQVGTTMITLEKPSALAKGSRMVIRAESLCP